MNISKAGLDLIKEFEGLRLSAYQDSVGVWTIGYGHTRTAKRGMSITVPVEPEQPAPETTTSPEATGE